jgi:hydroxyacylglutathione hydrolase
MIFRPYYYDDLGCAAYLFGCGTVGKGAVVRARVDDIDAYAEFATAKGLPSIGCGAISGTRWEPCWRV